MDAESGCIVYVFDELMEGVALLEGSPAASPALVEQAAQFSRASKSQLAAAGALGAANLVGALALCARVSTITPGMAAALGARGVLTLRLGSAPLLLFAVGFNAVPFVRARRVRAENAQVADRNALRADAAEQLERTARGGGATSLREKLAAAKRRVQTMRANRRGTAPTDAQQPVAYSTRPEAAATERRGSSLHLQRQRLLRQFPFFSCEFVPSLSLSRDTGSRPDAQSTRARQGIKHWVCGFCEKALFANTLRSARGRCARRLRPPTPRDQTSALMPVFRATRTRQRPTRHHARPPKTRSMSAIWPPPPRSSNPATRRDLSTRAPSREITVYGPWSPGAVISI